MPYRNHQSLATVLAVVALAAAACSGPAAHLEIGTQQAPLALTLGEIAAVQQAPIGPTSTPPLPANIPSLPPLVTADPATVPPSTAPPSSAPPTPLGPCPDFDPLASVVATGSRIPAPPETAAYPYRGRVIDVFPGGSSVFMGDSTWEVSAAPADPTTGAFDVTYDVTAGEGTTTRVYRILPTDIGSDPAADPAEQTNPNGIVQTINDLVIPKLGIDPLPQGFPNPGTYGLAGIYLVSQESNGVRFEPTVPIALLQLRQLLGARDEASVEASSIQSVGYDPARQAFMAFRSTVIDNGADVNACGTKLEGVRVAFTALEKPPPTPTDGILPTNAAMYAERSQTAPPTEPAANVLLFGQQITFGLQYGGLVLHDESATALLGGFQVDGQSPPPPPQGVTEDAILESFQAWYAEHAIVKSQTFEINVVPKTPAPPA